VNKISLLLHSVGHRVKTHNVTPDTGNERGDIEIKDYVILPHGEDDRIPPHTLVMDVTMTDMDVPLNIQTGLSQTDCPPQELPSLTVL